MKKVLVVLLCLLAIAAFAPVEKLSQLPSVIFRPAMSMSAPETQQTENWHTRDVLGFPAVVSEDDRSAIGIIAGELHASMSAEWWLFYTEAVNDPFLLVSVSVDGQVIALCEEATKVACDYKPNDKGGASVLALTTEQVKTIQRGKVIELTFYFNKEFVTATRSLQGISQPINELLATSTIPTPEQMPPQEEVTVPEWKLFETQDKMLGHVVLIHGPVETGEVVLSWSSVGYKDGLVKIKDYSGSELFFKPREGNVVTLEDAYWMHNGHRIDIEIVDACKKDDKKICVFRGGVSIVMSTTDLVWMQIGHKFILEWRDANGKLNISSLVLGPKSYSFNTRIQELMTPKDDGSFKAIPHSSV